MPPVMSGDNIGESEACTSGKKPEYAGSKHIYEIKCCFVNQVSPFSF